MGTVFPLYCTATGQAQTGSIFTNNQCHLMFVAGLSLATTFQYAFNPNNGGRRISASVPGATMSANGWKSGWSRAVWRRTP